jgi:hypothetical protein
MLAVAVTGRRALSGVMAQAGDERVDNYPLHSIASNVEDAAV